jgi:hypothetical protein
VSAPTHRTRVRTREHGTGRHRPPRPPAPLFPRLLVATAAALSSFFSPPAGAQPSEPVQLVPTEGPVGISPPRPVRAPDAAPAPAKPSTAPEAAAEIPVDIEYGYMEIWKEGPFQVLLLTGGVTIIKGPDTIQADSVVGWAAPAAGGDGEPSANLDVAKRMEQLYAEGNVRLSQKDRGTIMAEQAFLDLRRHEGIFLDFRARSLEPRSKQTFVIRAAEARQVMEDFLVAHHASVTTCTYGTPHYDIVVRRLEFSRSPESSRGSLSLDDMVVRVDSVPIGYLPALGYDLGEPFPLRRVAGGNSSHYGITALTEWGVPIRLQESDDEGSPRFDRRGLPVRKKWGDLTLDVDYREKRGWATGPDLKYKWHDEYEGFLDTYYLKDRGRNLSNGFDADLEAVSPLRHDDRGRLHAFHRQTLDANWRLDTEVNYISDRDLLLEFFPREQREEKEPESYLYLRGLYDNWGFVLYDRHTLNDWQEQVEYMPQAAVVGVAQPLWPQGLPGLLFFTTTQTDDVRWHHDFQAPATGPDERTWRFDSANELWYTLHLGPLNLAPFAGGRWSAFQQTLVDPGLQERFVGSAGGRAEIQAHNRYRLDWDLVGLHDLRHVVSGEVRYANNYACTIPTGDLMAFDTVESASKFEELTFRLNQHFQTKVGPPGKREVITFLWVGAALEMYPDPARDTTAYRPQNYLAPFNWITLPPEPDGVTFPERHYSNLFWSAELTPRSVLSFRVDGEYNTLDRHPEVTELTTQADPFSWWRIAVGYYTAHHVTETIRLTTYLQPTPRLNVYAQLSHDLLLNQSTGRRLAVQWDIHDAYLEFTFNYDPFRDEKQYLFGVSPKFGRARSLFPRDKELRLPGTGVFDPAATGGDTVK